MGLKKSPMDKVRGGPKDGKKVKKKGVSNFINKLMRKVFKGPEGKVNPLKRGANQKGVHCRILSKR